MQAAIRESSLRIVTAHHLLPCLEVTWSRGCKKKKEVITYNEQDDRMMGVVLANLKKECATSSEIEWEFPHGNYYNSQLI
jgi:hypothetical protein